MNVKLGGVVGLGNELQALKAPPLAWWAKDVKATEKVQRDIIAERTQHNSRRSAPGWEQKPPRGWELERAQTSIPPDVPEVRVARFRNEADLPSPLAGRDQEAAFTDTLLAATQPFYEEQFQQVYFEPDSNRREPVKPSPEPQAPEMLNALRLNTLIQTRRWLRNTSSSAI